MEKWNWLDKLIRYLRVREILPYLDKDATVCDLGCGDGDVLRFISPKIRYGCGIDEKIIDLCEGSLRFIAGDITKSLPLENNRFDIVLFLAVLEHLDSSESALKEIWRILKPGGKLILTTPMPRSRPLLEFFAFKLNFISKDEISDHKHYYSKQELKDLLAGFGFKIIKTKFFELGFNLLVVAEKI